jgi:hypothetical protein
MGREAEALQLLEEAIETDERVGARAWAARSRYEFARVACRSENRKVRSQAAQAFEEAREAAESLGLTDLKRRLGSLSAELG